MDAYHLVISGIQILWYQTLASRALRLIVNDCGWMVRAVKVRNATMMAVIPNAGWRGCNAFRCWKTVA